MVCHIAILPRRVEPTKLDSRSVTTEKPASLSGPITRRIGTSRQVVEAYRPYRHTGFAGACGDDRIEEE